MMRYTTTASTTRTATAPPAMSGVLLRAGAAGSVPCWFTQAWNAWVFALGSLESFDMGGHTTDTADLTSTGIPITRLGTRLGIEGSRCTGGYSSTMRTVVASLAASLAVTGLLGLAGCGAGPTAPAERAPAGAVTTPSAPPSAAPSAPLAAPVPIPRGSAPSRTYPVAEREDVWTRDGNRVLRTRTWYPDATGQFPVVLLSHGLGGRPEDFDPLATKWAAAGFAVVAPAFPNTRRGAPQFEITDIVNQPADVSFVLTQALAGPFRARLDGSRVAAAGHSAGGITTVGLFTAGRDARLRAGLVFAGSALGVSDAFAGTPAALLFIHGDADTVVRYAAGRAAFDRTPWSKAMLTLTGTGHSDFLQPSGAAYPAVSAMTLDFLRWSLYGDTAAKARMSADAKQYAFDDRL